ncbi:MULTISPECIES: glucosaminidase domain-containing protein [unclassified Lactobacillus]|uniref:glucosaminidase domain-containing protein n=1 Tax=unclassified Lactobacillus TaxID=2620435 RepID=UPI000EFB7471|nr:MULTISPECIES: glucosaminidase domain-containing protein [unclassified Lactobacillus]RMC38641.1 N-acetylmuramidase [Lactobacillus sp. ESL0237]RMC42986.1 N-acetylmuramidase [Lactobacillus sp. ESL0234]RMC43840.1 N-acetylmuramidase [Lactobacillus sp. ESL0236]RMC44842.1 N-acetylmuramidase [Lactobacillus sp. ESL0230]RMC48089.1 N-acetylmuramidase [Lactobacillus sp. ESL0225]
MKKKLITGISAAVLATTAVGPVTNNLIANSIWQTKPVSAAQGNEATFLNTAASQAQKVAKKYGLYPSVMIAQAIVESNWGQSGLAVNANNLFGMKADDSWPGETYAARTREEDKNGKSYYIVAKFRKYPSYQNSFDDNGKKLRQGVSWQPDRYQGAWLENATAYTDATKALTGTYATANNYNTILNNRITTYNLTQYDPQVSSTSKSYVVKKSGATYAWPTDHSVTTKTDSISKGDAVTVTKTITFYNGKQRLYISGKGWVNDSVLEMGSALPPAAQAPKNEKKVNKTLMHTAYIYDAKGNKAKGMKAIKVSGNGKVIATYGTKTINNKKYYRIGQNHYLAGGNIDGTMRILKHDTYVYNNYGNRDNQEIMKKGKSVATYGAAVSIYGVQYYRIGVNQYIKRADFSLN